MNRKKKILIPIFNRAHLGRLRSVLKAVSSHPMLELQIITAVPAAYGNLWFNLRHSKPRSWKLALPWYLRAKFLSFYKKRVLKEDLLSKSVINEGFRVDAYIPFFLDGGVTETMAKSVGFGLIGLVDVLKELKPDIVFVNADRFEMMAVAIAAAYLNIPIAHNEGGNISGTIDESVRHAITKLAHIHFTDTLNSRRRIIQMGEDPKMVFQVGSPSIDMMSRKTELNLSLSGIDLLSPYLLVLQHPVTTESDQSNAQVLMEIIDALEELKMPTIFIGSNTDAGSHHVGEVMRNWQKTSPSYVYFSKYLPADSFYAVLKGAACAIGNSSSFIREGSYFGTPAVLVGTRQSGRESGKNILDSESKASLIKEAILNQLKHGRYPSETIFGDGRAGERIAEYLARTESNIQKKFYEV